jgi:hypothetical protein
MLMPEYEVELYDAEGLDYGEAWEIMRERMKIPPSLEGFLHLYEQSGFEEPQDLAAYLAKRRR